MSTGRERVENSSKNKTDIILHVYILEEMCKPVFLCFLESTFIVLSKQLYEDVSFSEIGQFHTTASCYYVPDLIDCMVGDVNLFFNEPSDPSLTEVEVMIAGD